MSAIAAAGRHLRGNKFPPSIPESREAESFELPPQMLEDVALGRASLPVRLLRWR